jgi:phage FluMu gp28-like protein
MNLSSLETASVDQQNTNPKYSNRPAPCSTPAPSSFAPLKNPQSAIPNPQSPFGQSPICNLPSAISFRPYQRAIFDDHTTGIQILLWARQTGKSFTLAAWAVKRLLTRPGRLVTILSNSRSNGIELNRRCAEVCHLLNSAFEQIDLSPDNRFETFNTETRITINGQTSRIKVLAANPRTARGFSGDLILDEFAFHEDAAAIWEAAEPILASNPDYLCRIASTPNGKHNMFYRLCTSSNIPVSRITRTDAFHQGCPVFHPITRQKITPEQARALAQNKRAYDQNYQCQFEDQNMALLTHELITAAERPDIAVICEQHWTPDAIQFLTNFQSQICNYELPIPSSPSALSESSVASAARTSVLIRKACSNPSLPYATNPQSAFPIPQSLFAGIDVARHHDQTVITILEKIGSSFIVRAILRLRDMRLPDQQQQIETILALPNLKHAKIDMTGLGLGLFEYTHQKFPQKITGLNFSSTISLHSPSPSVLSVSSVNSVLIRNAPPTQTIRITEALATQLLQTFEDRALQIPIDQDLRDDLRKPERLVSPSGRVSIAATRDEAGHADHFWSLALALDAAKTPIGPPPASAPVHLRTNFTGGRAPRRHKLERE